MAERGGGAEQARGWGVGGMGDRVTILPYLGTLISYSYTAGKAVNKSNF
jgi:hypothetical protein